MKKLVCMLLALMLCVSCAFAESLAVGGMMLNIPAQWRVEKNVQAADGQYLEFSYLTDTPAHEISVAHAEMTNWDSIAATENGLMHFANLTASMLLAKLGDADLQIESETHIALRDGGHALKLVCKTANGSTAGVMAILFGGAAITVMATAEDSAQCEAWLDQIVLPLRVQEEMDLMGLTVGLPAGFQPADDSGMYFNENNEALKIAVQKTTAESVQAVLDEGSQKDLLLLTTQMLLSGLEYTNPQVEMVELAGMPAMVSSMDVTANGSAGCMGALAALRSDALVTVAFLGNQGGQRAAAELMQVITYPGQANGGFYMGDVPLGYPAGFRIKEYEKQDEQIHATISDQLLPEMTVISVLLTEEEKQMDVRTLLSLKMQEELSGVTGSEAKTEVTEYDDATAACITWYDDASVTRRANGIVFAATAESLTRIYMSWPNGDADQVRAVLQSVMPAPADDKTVTQGNVTLQIPNGWQLQESVPENGMTKYAAVGAGNLTAYCMTVRDDLRGMIDGMGVQTALEIYLSIWAGENGIEGITIDYAQSENGVHVVTSVLMDQQGAVGIAYLLDGDAFWQLAVETGADEETARALLNSVLAQVR